ncbi:MAG TPA: isoprenylcysteine carboxylmethyltransferase family protein [Roseiarcus sp.]|nr:isoprenylcysteine carboxylmethyltransferase family protein [Roseiarcus sp.]
MSWRNAPILAIVPPPVQFAVVFLAGAGLDRLSPWRPAWMAIGAVRWAGLALAIAGCALAAAAAGRFVLRRTTLHPTGRPSRLVASGAHAWSRNPMYLSLTVIYVGLALTLGRAWPLILVVLPWASMNWAVIPFEEARLSATFGPDYADYCRRVRRWI